MTARSRTVVRGAVILLAGVVTSLWLAVELAAQGSKPTATSEAARLIELVDLVPASSVAVIGDVATLLAEIETRIGAGGHLDSAGIDQVTLAGLTKGCCDLVIVRKLYYRLPDPKAIDATLIASIKPGGRLVVIDTEPTTVMVSDALNAAANRDEHGIKPEQVAEEFSNAGLVVNRFVLDWPTDKPRTFLMLFRKP
jgi:hypothetical protein